jgi:ornithine racemase
VTAPRLEIDLAGVHHNTRGLVDALAPLGIAVTGVTKAVLGAPDVAAAMLHGGAVRLGDSRIENLEVLRRAGVMAELMLIRSPMRSQVERVVAAADISCNSETTIVEALSDAAAVAGTVHQVVVMVDLGDRREGVVPEDLVALARRVVELPGVSLRGIGTNLACQSGVSPDRANMDELSSLAECVEVELGVRLDLVSGGNSANLDWALGGDRANAGRVNDLRLGESILLGRETLHRRAVPGLRTDVVGLVAEVIESKVKPSTPVGTIAQTAFGWAPPRSAREGEVARSILAVGQQDTDPAGLDPPDGIRIVGASSDHLVVASRAQLPLGSEVRFGVDYSALLRSMTSPFVDLVVESTLRGEG